MIELSAYSSKHLEATFDWMQNEELKNSFLFARTVTRESHQLWFDQLENDHSQKIMAITYDGVHVGNIGLKNIDNKNKKAEVWIYIGEMEFRGRGIARCALTNFVQSLAGQFNKLYAHVADFNYASLKLFLSSGFRIEGVLQKEMVFKGEFLNLYRLYILL